MSSYQDDETSQAASNALTASGSSAASSEIGRATSTWPLRRGFQFLGFIVRTGLRLVVLAAACHLALQVWGLRMVDDAFDVGDTDRLTTFDTLNVALIVSGAAMTALTGVVWMIWQYRLAKSALPGELRRGAGWHAFSPLVPIVSLWFPYQNMKDLWTRRRPYRSTGIIWFWWAGVIAIGLLTRSSIVARSSAFSVNDVKSVMTNDIILAAVEVITGLLALKIVAGLSVDERRPA